MTDKIKITLNGQVCHASKGQMLIEVADVNSVSIPRFCYHNKLSVAANCRMCLVEVEGVPKPLPACATPVAAGMVVNTQSSLALTAQESVMEFLLINHPLDCPICDQGGECELQDLAMGYGSDVSRYQENKRVVQDKNIGPLIQTDMTRCIHCTRCVRFGEEIAGLKEMGATGRGEHMEIGTYIERSIASELSGNMIDLCPVGALTSKPFRFSARAWELTQKRGIAPHDSVGSNLFLHIKDNRVKRVVPAETPEINEVWLSDRDRFSYEALYTSDRLLSPQIKKNGQWQTADWQEALALCAKKLGGLTNRSEKAEQFGALITPSASLEELYLFQKLFRALGCHNIDHRYRQRDFSNQAQLPSFPHLGRSIQSLENINTAFIIGANLRKEQPLINHRIRKAALNGAHVMALNSIDYDFNYALSAKQIVPPHALALELSSVLKALSNLPQQFAVHQSLVATPVSERHRKIATNLQQAQDVYILLGNTALASPDMAILYELASAIANECGATFGILNESANNAGAWLAGALPHRLPLAKIDSDAGLNAYEMFDKPRKGYMITGFEPELDCWDGGQAKAALQSAEFVISLSGYDSDSLREYADVILPYALFAETEGTYINNEGRHQYIEAAVPPQGEAKPGWKVLKVIANLLELKGFNYENTTDIMQAFSSVIDSEATLSPQSIVCNQANSTFAEFYQTKIQRIADIPMNALDSMTRRALALQATEDVADGKLHINAGTASNLGLQAGDHARVYQGENQATLPVHIDSRLPDQCALIHAAQSAHSLLGGCFDTIKIEVAK